jgi:lipid-binding SYLF domain-containing protein
MLKTPARPVGLLLTCALLLAGCASTKTLDDARTRADAAEQTFNNFMRDPQMTWLHQNIGRAKAVMITPQFLQAGFIFGGGGGNTVVLARGAGGRGWTGPAFYKMAAGSVGLQAGAESSELVAVVMTDKALASLLSSSFKLGGDVSIAAGPVGAGTGAPINADIVVYARSKGLYGGLNLSGTAVNTDDSANQAFYGRPASPVDILVKHTVTNELGNKLAGAVGQSEAQFATPSH